MMPGLDGLQLCRLIRAEPTLHYTYVVLLTSLGGKSRYLDGMNAGADDFLNKPYDEDLLAARLQVAERILALHHALRVEATQAIAVGSSPSRAAYLAECMRVAISGNPITPVVETVVQVLPKYSVNSAACAPANAAGVPHTEHAGFDERLEQVDGRNPDDRHRQLDLEHAGVDMGQALGLVGTALQAHARD